MSPRSFVIAVGVLLLGVGLFLGFKGSSVEMTYRSAECGSAFSPADYVGTDFGSSIRAETPQEKCDAQLSTNRTWSLVVLGVGLLTVLGGMIVHRPESAAELEHRARVNGGS